MKIDQSYILNILEKLLNIPSPTGYTDQIVRFTCKELDHLNVPYKLTRRGAIRATIKGKSQDQERATVSHLDTLGAMVRELKPNGRLSITMIGHWSPRFAEGARVTIFTDDKHYRGTILPLKASGHVYNDEIDTQPVSWDNLEIRVDELCHTKEDLEKFGFNIGDYVSVDTDPEFTDSGFIKSRHLDNKAGVACQLAAIKVMKDNNIVPPVDCHPLFTISEEEGSGASFSLRGDVSSLVAIDNSTIAPSQNSCEDTVNICMRDMAGIYDYHLTHKLIRLCEDNNIPHRRDIFKYYKSDASSAIAAGNDIRTALICFGLDASHGYERTHINSLMALSELIATYMTSDVEIERDKNKLSSLEGFTNQE